MSWKWSILSLTMCLGIMIGIAGAGSGSGYVKCGKKLVVEGTVFDLKSTTSLSPTVCGNVSDKTRRIATDASVNHTVALLRKLKNF